MRFPHSIKFALCSLSLLACGGDGAEDTIPANASEAVATYAQIVQANYDDTLAEAQELDAKIAAFIAAPDETKLEEARAAWRAAREPYLQTEVYRFYDGPIDNPDDGPEGLMNAWPLDEAYIDYVDGDAEAGIINGEGDIDAATLESLNEAGGEANIATGYHAIEFLLWGQDQDEAGPGQRPATDYIAGGDGTASNPDRRALYLQTVSTMLVGHLEGLAEAWASDTSAYRADFIAADPGDGLRKILTGMIILSGFETGGERLQAALDSGDQEDEHSCFSDNTHRDMIVDIEGIKNVWHGSYKNVSGVGIVDVVAERDAALAEAVTAKIDSSLELANALQPPFDREIASGNTAGRARVQALVISLREQEELLEDVFRLFELEIPAAE